MKRPLTAAFTLIELLVVTAIMMIVIGGSIAGYIQFSEYQTLVVAGREMENTIKFAQNRARIRVIENCASENFLGYRAVVSAVGTVDVYALCGSDPASPTQAPGAIKTTTPPSELDIAGGAANLDFFTLQSRQPPNVGTNLITLATTRHTYSITISSAGVISSAVTRNP
ncbi:MAG: hypothetical protein COU67_02125 [Candidatus Pacebacteria bacterium CG10_big_fil_rev_8_21_14_0_10_44_54]|nr:MAG: hypothetical protein COU67_02125 [Candidatus Pacebacteria bacterium CG10_big_fil_rev_8_21_14_0_10_44_54]